MNVSYNKLKTFGECPLKYRLSYIEKLPRPPIRWLSFQRRIHAALHQYHALAKLDGTVKVDELLRAYDELVGANQDAAVRETEEYQEGEEILRLYCDVESHKARVPAHLEHRIRVAFGPYTLTGKVDRIDFLPGGGYSIIDYKLDRKLPSANPAAVDRQLSFYQLLVYEGLGLSAEDVRLYYLRHGVEKIAPRTREHMRQTVEWVDHTAAAIGQERKWAPCEGDGCRTCAFSKLCPAKTGVERKAVGVWQQAEFEW